VERYVDRVPKPGRGGAIGPAYLHLNRPEVEYANAAQVRAAYDEVMWHPDANPHPFVDAVRGIAPRPDAVGPIPKPTNSGDIDHT
jgi:hypothetical protein